MTLLPEITLTPDVVVMTLNDGLVTTLRTPTQARQLGDLCRRPYHRHPRLRLQQDRDVHGLRGPAMTRLSPFAALLALTMPLLPTSGARVNEAVHASKDVHDAATSRLGVPAPVPHPRPRTPLREASQSRYSSGTGSLTDVTCYVWTGHRTASGVWPRVGMAAGNRWPFGTRLRVQRVGIVTITDRIGHSSELDLFFTSLSACLRFGRQQLRVQVLP